MGEHGESVPVTEASIPVLVNSSVGATVDPVGRYRFRGRENGQRPGIQKSHLWEKKKKKKNLSSSWWKQDVKPGKSQEKVAGQPQS